MLCFVQGVVHATIHHWCSTPNTYTEVSWSCESIEFGALFRVNVFFFWEGWQPQNDCDNGWANYRHPVKYFSIICFIVVAVDFFSFALAFRYFIFIFIHFYLRTHGFRISHLARHSARLCLFISYNFCTRRKPSIYTKPKRVRERDRENDREGERALDMEYTSRKVRAHTSNRSTWNTQSEWGRTKDIRC